MLTIKSNAKAFRRALQMRAKAEGKIVRNALNDTARDIAFKDLPRNIRRHFDAPTRFTQRAFYYERAVAIGGGNWKASVEYKYGGARLRRHYLEIQVEGGVRPPKGVEKLIKARFARGGFPDQLYPTSYVPRDRHGNVTRGFWNRVLADLQANRQVGSTSNRSDRSVKRNRNYRKERFFVPPLGHRLKPGVYVRRGKEIHPVLIGVKPMRYAKRLPLLEIERRAARHRFPLHLRRGRTKASKSG